MLIDIYQHEYGFDEILYYVGTVDVNEGETITQPIVTGELYHSFQIIWRIWNQEGRKDSFVKCLLRYNPPKNRLQRYLADRTEDSRVDRVAQGEAILDTKAFLNCRPYVKVRLKQQTTKRQ